MISFDIREALRSPFHVQTGADGPVALGFARPVVTRPLHLAFPAPSDDDAPDPRHVFMATLGGAVAADFGGYLLLLYGMGSDNVNNAPRVAALLGAVTIPAVVPAAAATLAGGRFRQGLRGSVAGLFTAWGAALFTSFFAGNDKVGAIAALAIHALVTSRAALHKGQVP